MLSLILIVTKNRQKCTKILTNTKLSTKMLQQLVVIVVTIVMTVGYFWIFLTININHSIKQKLTILCKKRSVLSKMQFLLTNKLPNYVIPVRSKWWKNWIIISKAKIATRTLQK